MEDNIDYDTLELIAPLDEEEEREELKQIEQLENKYLGNYLQK